MQPNLPQSDLKNYHKRDPLSFASGAFKGLTTMLPKGVNVVRQGGTFAVSSAFPWLVFGRSIGEVRGEDYTTKDRWLRAIYQDAQYKFQSSPESTTLYLPSPSAAGVTTINASAGVGGGVHEAGHVICDCANGRFPSYEEFRTRVGRHLDQSIEYYKCNMPKWTNITADMRLEPGMSLEFPEVEHRFFSIQEWCHQLESEHRGNNVPSDFMMALRDSGKGWINEDSKKVYSEYGQEAKDLVQHLRPIWSELKPKNTDWASSAHTPVYVAVEIINALHKLLEEPPEEGKGKGKGKGGGKGKGKGGGGGKGKGQGKGKGDGKEQGEGKDKGDGQGQGEGKDKGDGKDAGKSPMSLDEIKRLLDGEGEALDPSKAMEKEVNKNKQHLDHELYIPNGAKPVYRKLL